MLDRDKHLHMLGLKSGASVQEIKEAYRELAMVWHPDRFPEGSKVRGKAEEKFKEIKSAYDALLEGQPKQATASPLATRPDDSREVSKPPTTEPYVVTKFFIFVSLLFVLVFIGVRASVDRGEGTVSTDDVSSGSAREADPVRPSPEQIAKIKQGDRVLSSHGLSADELADRGALLWSSPSLSASGNTSCGTCHNHDGTDMKNASFIEPYPHSVEMARRRASTNEVTAAEMVQLCMTVPMQAEPLDWESVELAALVAYVRHLQDETARADSIAEAERQAEAERRQRALALCFQWSPRNPDEDKASANWYGDSVSVERTRFTRDLTGYNIDGEEYTTHIEALVRNRSKSNIQLTGGLVQYLDAGGSVIGERSCIGCQKSGTLQSGFVRDLKLYADDRPSITSRARILVSFTVEGCGG